MSKDFFNWYNHILSVGVDDASGAIFTVCIFTIYIKLNWEVFDIWWWFTLFDCCTHSNNYNYYVYYLYVAISFEIYSFIRIIYWQTAVLGVMRAHYKWNIYIKYTKQYNPYLNHSYLYYQTRCWEHDKTSGTILSENGAIL